MKSEKITEADIKDLRISSLSSNPTAPRSRGGNGMSAKEMKEAFDKLPLYILECYNRLIDDIVSFGEDSAAGSVPTGIKSGHTLHRLFCDIVSGDAASYLTVAGKSLSVQIAELNERMASLEALAKGESICV